MTDFTRQLQGPGGVQSLTPRQHQAQLGSGDIAKRFVADAAATLFESGIKGYAIETGEDIAGVGQTQQEIAAQAEQYRVENDRLLAQAQAEQGEVPLTPEQVADIKAEALGNIQATVNTVRRLTASNQLSSSEARAHVDMALRGALSNPLTAMFKDDFMNAAAAFTGGSGDIAQGFVTLSPQEEVAKRRAEAAAAADAEMWEQASAMAGPNGDVEFWYNRLAQQQQLNSQAEFMDSVQANATMTQEQINSGKVTSTLNSDYNSFLTQMASVMQTSPNGTVDMKSRQKFRVDIESTYRQRRTDILNMYKGNDQRSITAREKAFAELDSWKSSMDLALEATSDVTRAEEFMATTNAQLTGYAIQAAPHIAMANKAYGPAVAQIYADMPQQEAADFAAQWGLAEQDIGFMFDSIGSHARYMVDGAPIDEKTNLGYHIYGGQETGNLPSPEEEQIRMQERQAFNEAEEAVIPVLNNTELHQKAARGDEQSQAMVASAIEGSVGSFGAWTLAEEAKRQMMGDTTPVAPIQYRQALTPEELAQFDLLEGMAAKLADLPAPGFKVPSGSTFDSAGNVSKAKLEATLNLYRENPWYWKDRGFNSAEEAFNADILASTGDSRFRFGMEQPAEETPDEPTE